MTSPDREARVLAAVVALVDSLLDDFDIVELLTDLTERCTQLLDIESAALLLGDTRRHLHLMAATSDRTEEIELFQLQADEGPCLDCYTSGRPVSIPDLATTYGRWPHFAPAAVAAGFISVHAVPMRAAGTTLGTLGLFGTRIGELGAADLLVGRSLVHVASVAIVQEHAPNPRAVLPNLRTALINGVVVEQAKGLLRESLGVTISEAFALLRSYAQFSGTHLSLVARQLISDPAARPALLSAIRQHAAS